MFKLKTPKQVVQEKKSPRGKAQVQAGNPIGFSLIISSSQGPPEFFFFIQNTHIIIVF